MPLFTGRVVRPLGAVLGVRERLDVPDVVPFVPIFAVDRHTVRVLPAQFQIFRLYTPFFELLHGDRKSQPALSGAGPDAVQDVCPRVALLQYPGAAFPAMREVIPSVIERPPVAAPLGGTLLLLGAGRLGFARSLFPTVIAHRGIRTNTRRYFSLAT